MRRPRHIRPSGVVASAPLAVTAVTALSLLPASAFAVDYLTLEQAQHALFPEAQQFQPAGLRLTAQDLQAFQQRYGVNVRSPHWRIWRVLQQDQLVGWVVVDDVVGKFELISYAVGIGLDGAIRQIEILSYRESHGSEIRLPAWRQQFVGKTSQSPLELGQDIRNISGATLSCKHVTEGVKRISALIDFARQSGQLK